MTSALICEGRHMSFCQQASAFHSQKNCAVSDVIFTSCNESHSDVIKQLRRFAQVCSTYRNWTCISLPFKTRKKESHWVSVFYSYFWFGYCCSFIFVLTDSTFLWHLSFLQINIFCADQLDRTFYKGGSSKCIVIRANYVIAVYCAALITILVIYPITSK